MPEIEFDKNFPDSLRAEIEQLLNEWVWLCPAWLQRLYVGYDAYDTNNEAKVRVVKDNRFARLTFCSSYITNTGDVMRDDLIHELIHCFISPLKNYSLEVIEKLCKDNNLLYEIIEAELISRNEQITQDIAYAIFKKFK